MFRFSQNVTNAGSRTTYSEIQSKCDQHGVLNSLFRNSVKTWPTNTGPKRPFRCLDFVSFFCISSTHNISFSMVSFLELISVWFFLPENIEMSNFVLHWVAYLQLRLKGNCKVNDNLWKAFSQEGVVSDQWSVKDSRSHIDAKDGCCWWVQSKIQGFCCNS